jgi:hypothetical protein
VPFVTYHLTDGGVTGTLEGENLLGGLRVEWY